MFFLGEQNDEGELGRLLQLILGCAVNCEDKQEYIQRIMSMEESVQVVVMNAIQEVRTSKWFSFIRTSLSQYQLAESLQFELVTVMYIYFPYILMCRLTCKLKIILQLMMKEMPANTDNASEVSEQVSAVVDNVVVKLSSNVENVLWKQRLKIIWQH